MQCLQIEYASSLPYVIPVTWGQASSACSRMEVKSSHIGNGIDMVCVQCGHIRSMTNDLHNVGDNVLWPMDQADATPHVPSGDLTSSFDCFSVTRAEGSFRDQRANQAEDPRSFLEETMRSFSVTSITHTYRHGKGEVDPDGAFSPLRFADGWRD